MDLFLIETSHRAVRHISIPRQLKPTRVPGCDRVLLLREKGTRVWFLAAMLVGAPIVRPVWLQVVLDSVFVPPRGHSNKMFTSASRNREGGRTRNGRGSLKDTFGHLKHGFFQQNKGKPPFTRQCSGENCKDPCFASNMQNGVAVVPCRTRWSSSCMQCDRRRRRVANEDCVKLDSHVRLSFCWMGIHHL